MPTTLSSPPARHRPPWWIRRCILLLLGVSVMLCAAGTAPGWASPVTTPPPVLPVTTTPAAPAPAPGPTQAPVTPATPTPPTTAAPGPSPGQPCADTDTGCAQPPGSDQDPAAAPEPECSLDNISGCVIKAMDGFFSEIVSSALNPLLTLLSTTLLETPDLAHLPRIGKLWTSSWQITVTVYGLLVMAAGVLVMSYQTLQSRWSLREIAPGLVIGMLAAGMSFPLVTHAVQGANALSAAVARDGGLDPDSAGQALRQMVTSSTMAGSFGLLLVIVLVVLVVALLAGYVIRVAITIVLIVAAPLALMCHALPMTEPVARWWWRSMAACLAIQVVQSITLITAVRVFLTPGDWHVFSGSNSGTVDLIVSIALVGILVKIPFWMLSAMRIGSGRSVVGGMARSYLTYKTFGLLKGSHSKPRKPVKRPKPDPYDFAQTLPNGQMMLPLQGLKFARPKPQPKPPRPTGNTAGSPSPNAGQQLSLDFSTPAPSLPPEAPRPPGQRALFYASPVKKTPTRRPTTPGKAAPTGSGQATPPPVKRTPTGRQLALRFPPPQTAPGPKARGREAAERPASTADGQYVLPLSVTRVKKPTPPAAPAWIAPPAPRAQGRQLHLPLPDLPVRRRRRPDTRGGAR